MSRHEAAESDAGLFMKTHIQRTEAAHMGAIGRARVVIGAE
jgi:hypothetical protein